MIEQTFHQHLDLPAAFLATKQAAHAAPALSFITSRSPARSHCGRLGEVAVLSMQSLALDDQQAARRTLRQGRLRHQFRRAAA
jgi:hypothetical protein